MNFQIGDVVVLKNDRSTKMTVSSIIKDKAECKYFINSKLYVELYFLKDIIHV